MYKVFLGVGHGGKDSGAVGGGLRESDINLSIAKYCRTELERHGVQVRMSREKDEDDTTADEVRECNAFAPQLAVDIHTNSGGGDGFEAFCSVNGGTGRTLAGNVEQEVLKIGQNSRGIKTRTNDRGTDYFGFIRSTSCPAVILECAFIDTPADRAQIDTEQERKTFGEAYARGILRTLGVNVLPQADELAALKAKVKERFGFEESTITFLSGHPCPLALFEKMANK